MGPVLVRDTLCAAPHHFEGHSCDTGSYFHTPPAAQLLLMRDGRSRLTHVTSPSTQQLASTSRLLSSARLSSPIFTLPRRSAGMICTRRMNHLKKIDMCTVVPYEYKSVSDVLNGLIYLILSSSTRVDAVWRALRPFKDG